MEQIKQTSSIREKFNAIDIMKFLMAFVVVLIHTNSFAVPNEYVDFFLNRVITMLAVPFFFVASGFFFFREIQFENGKIKKCPENKTRLFSFLKRTAALYLIWAVIYLVWQVFSWIDMGVMTFANFKGYIVSFFTEGFSEQFWYLLFMMYAMIVLYILLRFLRVEIVAVVSVVLCFLYFYTCTYSTALQGAESVAWLDRVANTVCQINLVGGIGFWIALMYFGMCFLLMGLVCVKLRDKISTSAAGILMIASLVLCTAEVSVLRYAYSVPQRSQSLTFIPLALFLVLFLSKLKGKGNGKVFAFLRKMSTVIFCVHYLPIHIFNYFTGHEFYRQPYSFAIVASISLVIAVVIVLLSDKIKFLKKLY